MIESAALLECLLELEDDRRWELAVLLAESASVEAIRLAQKLFESIDEERAAAERAELEAILDRTDATRTATESLALLMAPAQRRASQS